MPCFCLSFDVFFYSEIPKNRLPDDVKMRTRHVFYKKGCLFLTEIRQGDAMNMFAYPTALLPCLFFHGRGRAVFAFHERYISQHIHTTFF